MIYLLPFIAAIIGWFTNFLAVKMLFHPKEKKKFLFLEIQGIFPKRQAEIAVKLGQIVAKELVSFDDIKSKLQSPENIRQAQDIIEDRLDEFLEEKFPQSYPMLAMFATDKIKTKFKEQGMSEIKAAIPVVINEYSKKIEKSIDIEKIVQQKVVQFSSEKLESIIFSILQKEFRFIEIVGAFLGFLIGLIQLVLVLAFP